MQSEKKESIALLIGNLLDKNAPLACAASEKLIAISETSGEVMAFFDDILPMLAHKSSFVRNRALAVLAALAKWDTEGKTESILDLYLSHITDEKPITARICIQNLPKIAQALPCLAPRIRSALTDSKPDYRESMQPLIEKDILAALAALEEEQNGI